jgi:hypothetical protein
MKQFFLKIAAIASLTGASLAYAQFGSGVVFDPTQSAHAVQQINQEGQLYTTTVETTKNVISAYNLAKQMASSPSSLYRSLTSSSTLWTNIQSSPNTYSNTSGWTIAINTGSGASTAYQQATIPRTSQLNGYSNLSTTAQKQIAAQGATADLNDAVTASNIQTLGTIRANAQKRQSDINTLESATLSSDESQHTELATLQRINLALLLLLKQQEEANQISQAYTLQHIVAQKQQQDALKMTFQQANQFQSGYTSVAPSYSGAAAAMRY